MYGTDDQFIKFNDIQHLEVFGGGSATVRGDQNNNYINTNFEAYGGSGDDYLSTNEAVNISGEDGNDILEFSGGYGGAHIDGGAGVDTLKIENYFFQRKEELDTYIFNIIRLKNKDLADELFFRLEEGESNFASLAKKHAIYSDLYPEGIYGPVTIKGFHPIIKKNLINSTEGELLQPFQADDWWIIIKLIEKREAKLNFITRKNLFLEMFDTFVDKITKEILEDYANGYL